MTMNSLWADMIGLFSSSSGQPYYNDHYTLRIFGRAVSYLWLDSVIVNTYKEIFTIEPKVNNVISSAFSQSRDSTSVPQQ